jgi:riboflavin biosynthesis pyrimidine reductase
VFVAPMLLGDPLARSITEDLGIRALADGLRFRLEGLRRSGPDALLEFVPESP